LFHFPIIGRIAEGIVGNASNAKSCHITIRNLKDDQLGTWKCKVSHTESKQFQEAHLTVTPSGKSFNVRLPKHLKPRKYNIYLTPFIELGNFTIPGHVDIVISVLEDNARNITLHSEKTDIYENTIRVLNGDENEQKIEGFGYDKERHCFIIFLADSLPKGENITVSIDFLAELNSDLSGFYRSSYFDEEKNATEYIATTQFEAIGARRALPCFDEPAFKAVFQVNLGRLKDMNSISNMPAEFEGVPMADNSDYMWDMYQDSPIMSTYLLAFIISRFTYKQSEATSNGVQFRIWSRKSVSDQTELAATVGPQILEFFERHYNVPFPLPKMDMIAIPDFGAGAMENWGLITYRETALLYKEGQSSVGDRESIVSVISHELAHQWFGNLVTMEWWSE
jgi:aminopeptidase N